MTDTTTNDRLEYLRGQLRAESMSWGELAELQSLAASIDPGDVELLEAAGVPEYPEDDNHNGGNEMTRNYIIDYEGNVQAAVLAMAADLMRGDAATFQRGYTLENALTAAAEALAPGQAGEVVGGIGGAATYAYIMAQGSISGI